MHSRILSALLVCAVASSCAAPAASVRSWVSARERDHPLAGRIWDVQNGRFAAPSTLHLAVRDAHFVLLGETHDNPDHHLMQAEFVRATSVAGRHPALAFEMLDVTQQAAVDAALSASPGNPDAIAEAVRWATSGWPAFALYRPIFVAGLDGGLKIVAANLPRERVKAVVTGGLAQLDPTVRARIEREGPYPAPLDAALREEMAESHCGQLPQAMLEPMVLAQRARDAQMEQRLIAADAGDGAVLIAGTGHVRVDTGVPVLLRKDVPGPGRTIVSVAFVEVEPGWNAASDYARRWRGSLPFDYVVFTPATERKDPCEVFHKK